MTGARAPAADLVLRVRLRLLLYRSCYRESSDSILCSHFLRLVNQTQLSERIGRDTGTIYRPGMARAKGASASRKRRFSKRKRQIDILITENTPVGKLKTVVDAKCFRRKVDVKAIDGLAGFVEDVGAQKGMLITNLGYTKAALKRAYYGPSDLELDILNFSSLQSLQAFVAIPYAGENSFLVRAPFGWVIGVPSARLHDSI